MTAKKTKKTEENVLMEKKLSELENNWKRALADYQNLEKRFAEERIQIIDFANANLVGRLLSVVDNLEMLFAHTQDKSIEMVLKDFKNILKEEHVSEIDVTGKDFDSNVMDALEMVDGEEGKVVEVARKGYKFKNKLIRPALVKVGNGLHV